MTDYPGVYLGQVATDNGTESLHYKKANRHLLTFGIPGAAKSAGLLANNLAHLKQSMIVIDPKGQLAAISGRKRALMGKVIMLNPLNMHVDDYPHLESHGWNPVLELDPARDDFPKIAACIMDAIMTKSDGGGSSKFFDLSAENWGSLFVMAERIQNPKAPSLRNIAWALTQPVGFDDKKQPVAGLALALDTMRKSHIFAVRLLANRIYGRLADNSSQQTSVQDVIDTLFKDFRFLNDDRLHVDMVRGKAMPWKSLHEDITTIYLIVPAHELDPQGLGKWLRLFINLALRGLYENPPGNNPKLPRVLFMLDEFGSALGRLDEIPKALGITRDYSVCMWFVLQNLAQLKHNYPNEWSLFFTGSGAINSFRCGDFETASYLSQLLGSAEWRVPTTQQDGRVSLSAQAHPLIRPEDLMRLPERVTVNLVDPSPWPIRAEVPIYVDTPWAAGLDPNPYYRGPALRGGVAG